MNPRSILLLVEDSHWKKTRGLTARLKLGAVAALAGAGMTHDAGLTILLADDKKLHTLNRDFRGKDKPTNVLSFPAALDDGEKPYLGDVAIAFGVTRREAEAAGKSVADHAVHLVVHGVLHLLGYDHERARDAKAMETLEVKILAGLDIADPYKVIRA